MASLHHMAVSKPCVVIYDSVDENATPQFLIYKNYLYMYFLMIIVYIYLLYVIY